MPLLQGYTVGFVDDTRRKIAIQFLDNKPSEYELSEIVRFFKKYKKKIFIDREKQNINYMVMDWDIWVTFLIKLGFHKTANAVCDVLNDLEQSHPFDPLEHFNNILRAKPIDVFKEPRIIEEDERTEEEIERQKRREIRRLKRTARDAEVKETMFHCTKRENLDDILTYGLKPNTPEGISNAKKGVYLSVHPFDWMHYITKETTVAGVMIEIDIVGLKLIVDDGIFDREDWKSHPAYVCPDEIPVEKFINVSVSTDEKPYSFEKFMPDEYHKLQNL